MEIILLNGNQELIYLICKIPVPWFNSFYIFFENGFV
jgi:hypothetical protein